MKTELIIGIASGGSGAVVGALVVGIVKPILVAAGRWVWAQVARGVRVSRGRFWGWQANRHRRRVEPTLHKVAELVSKQGDFKATHPLWWTEPPRKLWCEATVQLIESGVDWRIEYPQHGAAVERRGMSMYVWWGKFHVYGPRDIQGSGSIGGSGIPTNAYWDWGDVLPMVGGPMIVDGRVTAEEPEAGGQVTREEAIHGR